MTETMSSLHSCDPRHSTQFGFMYIILTNAVGPGLIVFSVTISDYHQNIGHFKIAHEIVVRFCSLKLVELKKYAYKVLQSYK